MLVVGLSAVILGGVWFEMLVVFAAGVMIWELWSMIAPSRNVPAMLLGVAAATILAAQLDLTGAPMLALFAAVPIAGAFLIRREAFLFGLFALGIEIATFAVITFRSDFGFTWILWVMLVVIASDTFGYLAGRMLGGPKFWPKVSPKKTWSGTIAGWVGAGVVGFIYTLFTDAGLIIVVISMFVAFAGQMGDIAESALKRRVGIKDSSDLIPGHGGLLDRFDAMLGASLFLVVLIYVLRVPGVAF